MIKTTGTEWNRFYSDPHIWGEGAWHEEETITVTVDEVEVDHTDLTSLPEKSIVKLSGGIVFSPISEKGQSLEGLFKKWRKNQSSTILIVEVDNAKLEALKTVITANGGKIS